MPACACDEVARLHRDHPVELAQRQELAPPAGPSRASCRRRAGSATGRRASASASSSATSSSVVGRSIRTALRGRPPRPGARGGTRAPRRTAAAWAAACRGWTGAGIERRAQPVHHVRSAPVNIFGIEHALSWPTPCSPVIDPPCVDAQLEDARRHLERARRALLGPVVQHQRVQVAVAGVEHVADPQAVLGLQLADAAQHLGQLRPRDHAVLHVVVGRHAAHRGERGLAALPHQRPLLGVSARRISVAPAARHSSSMTGPSERTSAARAVQLDQQRRLAVAVAGVHRRLGGLDREPVHHLDRRRARRPPR